MMLQSCNTIKNPLYERKFYTIREILQAFLCGSKANHNSLAINCSEMRIRIVDFLGQISRMTSKYISVIIRRVTNIS